MSYYKVFVDKYSDFNASDLLDDYAYDKLAFAQLAPSNYCVDTFDVSLDDDFTLIFVECDNSICLGIISNYKAYDYPKGDVLKAIGKVARYDTFDEEVKRIRQDEHKDEIKQKMQKRLHELNQMHAFEKAAKNDLEMSNLLEEYENASNDYKAMDNLTLANDDTLENLDDDFDNLDPIDTNFNEEAIKNYNETRDKIREIIRNSPKKDIDNQKTTSKKEKSSENNSGLSIYNKVMDAFANSGIDLNKPIVDDEEKTKTNKSDTDKSDAKKDSDETPIDFGL